MDITTLGYYIAIVPGTILGLCAIAGMSWTLYEIGKLTVEAYKDRQWIALAAMSLLWWSLIGIALIVIGDLT